MVWPAIINLVMADLKKRKKERKKERKRKKKRKTTTTTTTTKQLCVCIMRAALYRYIFYLVWFWGSKSKRKCFSVRILFTNVKLPYSMSHIRGVSKGGGRSWGARYPPFGRPSFEQTTYNIQVAKTP